MKFLEPKTKLFFSILEVKPSLDTTFSINNS